MKIVVVDYQLGNISSIINMLKKIGVDAIHSAKKEDIQAADKLILPGVGAFDHGVRNLQERGLVDILNEEVLVKTKPVLGICLGMQLLLNTSEEGKLNGLGWIKGGCVRFRFQNEQDNLKVPHMGWNVVKTSVNDETRFYFVHSYYAVCENTENVLATTHHGHTFPAIIGHKNILGVQFHPEKSHQFGMQFLMNFIENKI